MTKTYWHEFRSFWRLEFTRWLTMEVPKRAPWMGEKRMPQKEMMRKFEEKEPSFLDTS